MSNLITRYGGGIRKRGKNYYYYFEGKKIDGKRNKIEKSAKTSNKSEALITLEKALENYYYSDIQFAESDISFVEAREKYLSEYVLPNLKDNSYNSYSQMLNKPQIKELEKYLLKDIKTIHIQKIINNMILNGFNKKNMIDMVLRTLSYLFNYFIDKGYISENPCKKVVLPSNLKPAEPKIVLTNEQINIILHRFYDTHWYLPLVLSLYTGMRCGECCRLRWENVDMNKRIIHIRENLVYSVNKEWIITTPKTKSSIRDVNIPKPLYEALEWQLERNKANGIATNPNTHVLIRDNGKIITSGTVKYLARVINYDLGIKFNYHCLRHTFATLLIEQGANIKDVSVLLGHTNIKTTMNIYVSVTDNMREETINILNTLYDE